MTSKDVREDIEKVLNTKSEAVSKDVNSADIGRTVKPPVLKVGIGNFAGKTLKITKSTFYNGAQAFVMKGTKWEEIPQHFKKGSSAMVFKNEEFE